jgi:uncharacterized protein
MNLSDNEKQRLKNKYGKWAVVTGASSGIGRELAKRLAEAGLNLVINARRTEELEKIKQDWQAQYQVEIQIVAADVSEPDTIDKIVKATAHLDVGLLVVSAGYGTSGLFMRSSLREEINMLRVNCEALLEITHYFCQLFAQKQRGGIILMSSIVALQGVPYSAHYAATKAYVQSLAEALAVEMRPFGVDVLATIPGPVESGFAGRANMQMNGAKPSEIGIPILKALGRQSSVLPGFLSKFLVGSVSMLPRWARVQAMKTIMGGMTQHQRK